MKILYKYIRPESVISFIQSIPRVKQPVLTDFHQKEILKHRCFKLIEDFDVDQITSSTEGYGTADERIERLIAKGEIIDINIINRYTRVPTDPLVIDETNSILDGMHRLSYLRDNNIRSYPVYKGISYLNRTS